MKPAPQLNTHSEANEILLVCLLRHTSEVFFLENIIKERASSRVRYKSNSPGELYSLPTAPLVLALPFRAAKNRRASCSHLYLYGTREWTDGRERATTRWFLKAKGSGLVARNGSNLALRRSPPARGGPTYLPTYLPTRRGPRPQNLPTYLPT